MRQAGCSAVNNDYLACLSEIGLVGVWPWPSPSSGWSCESLWAGVIRARLDHPSAPYALALAGMALQANSFHSLLLLGTWVVIGLLIAGMRLVGERPGEATESRGPARGPPTCRPGEFGRRMRIVIDGRMLSWTGIGRYTLPCWKGSRRSIRPTSTWCSCASTTGDRWEPRRRQLHARRMRYRLRTRWRSRRGCPGSSTA